MDGNLGPVAKATGVSSTTVGGSASGQLTLACIIRTPASLAQGNKQLINGSSFGLGTANSTSWQWWTGASTSGSFSNTTIAANTPYFVLMSMLSGGTWYLTMCNLNTGQIQTATASPATTFTTSASIFIGTGTGGGGASTFLNAAAMASNAYLLPSAQAVVAADPWSFWYPRGVLQSMAWMTAQAQADVLMAQILT